MGALKVGVLTILAVVLLLATASTVGAAEEKLFSPEKLYKQTIETWQQKYSRRSPTSWEVWKEFATTITAKYESIIGKDGDYDATTATHPNGPSAVDIVGAMEEGILTIERFVFQQQEQESSGNIADDDARDASLAVLYTEYGRLLLYSSETTITSIDNSATHSGSSRHHRCHELSKDPHTLLIGAPERLNEYHKKQLNDDDVDDQDLLASLFGSLCRDNAENALRNAISLDASCDEAKKLLDGIITTSSSGDTRKPKEFVAELFDSFADIFDEKLTKTLDYRVPQIIGSKVAELLLERPKTVLFRNVLDAGCGTGLAGRELRNAIDNESNTNGDERIVLVGVDASPKMLEIAGHCTNSKGCGLPTTASASTTTDNHPNNNDSRPLYNALIDLDLEEMTLENTLQVAATTTTQQQDQDNSSFDLIVAADVFVYFGSLETILEVFSGLQNTRDGGSILVFTCERTTPEEAPLGYRLLSTGRFAHTRDHAVNAASACGYSLVDYSEIVPRTEKGVAVDGHLFVFEHTHTGGGDGTATNDESEL